MIVTLWSGSACGQERRHDGVAGLVVRAGDPLVLGHRQRLALDAHQHLVARLHRDRGRVTIWRPPRTANSAASFTRFARSAPEKPGVPRAICRRSTSASSGDLPRVNAENLLAPLDVGRADGHLAIEPARAQQRRVEDVGAVGRRDDDDALVGGEAVHLDEQLVERLLALFVAERVAAAAAADRVELVDEDDAGRDGGARP